MISLIYEAVNACILALAGFCSILSFMPGTAITAVHAASAVVCTVSFVLFLRMKLRGRLIAAGAAVSVLAAYGPVTVYEWASGHQWALIAAGTGLISVIIVKAMKRIPAVRIIPVLAGIGLSGVCLQRGLYLHKAAVLMILLFIVMSASERVQAGWKKEGTTDREAHALHIMPFLSAVFLVLFWLKAPGQPYDWKLVRDLFRNVRSGYEQLVQSLDLRDSWVEGEGRVGFSDESGFFSSVRNSEYEVFEITTDSALGTRIYLSGRSFDSFDGRQWIKTDAGTDNARLYDLFETAACIADYEPMHVLDYIRSSGLKIRFKGIRSEYVFLPLKAVPALKDRTTEQIGGDLLFPNRRTRSYTVDFFRLNRAYEGFETMLGKQEPDGRFPDIETLQTAANILHQDLSSVSKEDLQAYRNRIDTVYGEKPGLSDAMKDYLNDLLAGAQNDYEKLSRLETAFQNMEYTTEPGELPSSISSPQAFADYLCFESKRGYCTHFATAFVLLAREAGIPARYVQGYCFTTSSAGATNVYSGTAHAWAEAYIEGFGWLDFDPTPGYKQAGGWKVRDHSRQETNSVTIAAQDEEDEEEDTSSTVHTTAGQSEQSARRGRIPAVILWPILFLLLVIPGDIAVRRFRYRRTAAKDKVTWLFRRCLTLLKRMKLAPAEGETLSEFAERASASIPSELLEFIPLYESIFYGERPVEEADIAVFERTRSRLFRLWLQRLAKRRRNP